MYRLSATTTKRLRDVHNVDIEYVDLDLAIEDAEYLLLHDPSSPFIKNVSVIISTTGEVIFTKSRQYDLLNS